MSAVQYYKLLVCNQHVLVFVCVCVHDVNMQEVNAYVPVMSPYIHSA